MTSRVLWRDPLSVAERLTRHARKVNGSTSSLVGMRKVLIGSMLAAILAAPVLAGCVGGPTRAETDRPVEADPEAPGDGRSSAANQSPDVTDEPSDGTVIHGPAGTPRPREAFPASSPNVSLRRVPGPAFEPTVGVDGEGAVVYLGMDPGSGIRSRVLRSTDDGRSWTDVTHRPAGGRHPFSNDPFLHVDPLGGRIFHLDMTGGGTCNVLSISDDGGGAWLTNPRACPTIPNDHPNLFAGLPREATTIGYPSLVYLCANDFGQGVGGGASVTCSVSRDGGLSFGPPVEVYSFEGRTCPESWGPGHGTVGPDGVAYLPHVACGEVVVHTSADDGGSWTRRVVDDSLGSYRGSHEARVAVDDGGTVYVTWIADDGIPRLSRSSDRGGSWSDPIQIAPDSLRRARFPAIVAGAEGRIAVQYLGTAAGGTWYPYLGFTVDGRDDAPTFATVRATLDGDPLAVGDCQDRCDGVGDFLDLALDPDSGRVRVALVDATEPFPRLDGLPGGPPPIGRGVVAVQTGGPSLR